MAALANLNAVSKNLPPIKSLRNTKRNFKRGQIVGFQGSKTQEITECPVQSTRRAALVLATVVLSGHFSDKISLAQDNGFWYEMPFPQPSVTNSKLS